MPQSGISNTKAILSQIVLSLLCEKTHPVAVQSEIKPAETLALKKHAHLFFLSNCNSTRGTCTTYYGTALRCLAS